MNASRNEQLAERPYGWVIVGVTTVCLTLGFGSNSTVSVFMKPFEQEFGWTRAEISMAFTLLTVGCAIGGIVWGSLSDRIGARKVGYLGAFAISFGLIAVRWQSDLWTLYLIYFLIGAVGFAPLFAPMVAIAGLWFERRKGFAIGIVTAGGAIGQGVVPYITRLLITEVGWRDAALYVGVGYLLILLPLLFLLKPPPTTQHSSGGLNATDSNQWRVPHKVSIAWLSVAGFFCCVCMAVPLVHLIPLGIDLGCSPQTAAGLLLSLMIAGVFGRLFFGWLADRIGGLPAYFLASLAQTSVVFWFTQTKDIMLLFQLSVLFGFGFAGVMTCLLICAREAAPLRISGTAIAIVSTTAWIGMGLGSYQAGYFYDLTGAYLLPYGNAALGGLANLAVVGLLFWYRKYQNSRPRIPAIGPNAHVRV